MADHYAVPDGGECKVSALIHPRSSPGSPLSPRPNSAAPAAKSARAGGPQHLAAARFVVGGQPMAVSGVDPHTIGLNKWSVWRLQGWLGSLMSTRIAAFADVHDRQLSGISVQFHQKLLVCARLVPKADSRRVAFCKQALLLALVNRLLILKIAERPGLYASDIYCAPDLLRLLR